jgi:2-polyprenyl-6-methoxyphenol hydroxylase-like FAD-dependent oxidoreductase
MNPARSPAAEFYDAAIIGAGPAGSAAAILLARAGWRVALVEKERFPRRKVCGECIAASNLPLLEALGLGPAVAGAAGPELRTVLLLHGAACASASLPPGTDERFAWGRALGREMLDGLLLEAAQRAGAVVLQPWDVRAIDGGAGRWRLELQSVPDRALRRLHVPVAIAAYGSWTAPPEGAPRCRSPRRASDLFAFKANFRDASLAPGALPLLALDGGYGGMVLADQGRVTVACCVRRDRLDALRGREPGRSAGAVVEDWLRRECAAVNRALHASSRDGAWLASGPIEPGVRLRADDQLLRIGNAAGEAHPILGEGISMALQSAGLLCAELLQESAGEAPGDGIVADGWQARAARRYAGQWRRQFAPRLRLAAIVAHLAMRPPAAALALALARTWPGIVTRGARWGGKVRSAVDPAVYGASLSRGSSPS